jgi:hypothetical protein
LEVDASGELAPWAVATAASHQVQGGLMLSFARDIRPLFRDDDVKEMKYAFDLSRHEDVRANAEGIYERVADGSMPCDGAWPADRIALFRRWVDEGSAP